MATGYGQEKCSPVSLHTAQEHLEEKRIKIRYYSA